MANKILFRRGLRENLPADLALGEPAVTVDSGEVFVGGDGGNIQLDNKAILNGGPDFRESNEVLAEFSESGIQGDGILGEGWRMESDGVYAHEAGYTKNLAFPVQYVKGDFYEIVYNQTGTAKDAGFSMVFTSKATDTGGDTVKAGVYYDTTFIICANSNRSFLTVQPSADWSGTFKLQRVRRAVLVNSGSLSAKGVGLVVRGSSLALGGGRVVTGADNTGFGQGALAGCAGGKSNTAAGYNALKYNSSGDYNTAVGSNALSSNTLGKSNTAVGSGAMSGNVNGTDNTAVGPSALSGGVNAKSNTGLGYHALSGNLAGGSNVAIGATAGRYLSGGAVQTTVNNSVFVGAESRGSVDDGRSNQIVIGYKALGGGSNTVTLGNNSITQLRCQVTAITALSDSRTKEYHQAADLQKCYQAVRDLPVSRYKYHRYTGAHLDENVTGWLADDVEKVFPKSVSCTDRYFPVLDENGKQVYDADGQPKMFLMESVKEITMTEALPTLWGAVQQLMSEVEQLRGQLAAIQKGGCLIGE